MEQTQSLESLMKDVGEEQAVLPEFQRDFVWETSRTLDLFDSIVKDIFIGAIIYGIPSFEISTRAIDDRERKKKGRKRKSLPIKHFTKEEIAKKQKLDKSNFRLILDGQQRITSIYRALKGIDYVYYIRSRDEELDNDILEKKPADRTLEDLLFSFDAEEDTARISIKLSDAWRILNEDFFESEIKTEFFHKSQFYHEKKGEDDFDEELLFRNYLTTLRKIQDLFKAEKLLSYYLLDMTLDKFVLFFERSNSRGIQLNFIDILTAKLYEGFNLKAEIKEFETQNTGYDLVPEIIVRTIAFMISKERFDELGKSIEIHRTFILTELNAEHFNKYWHSTINWYKNALDFLFNNHFLLNQNWMPYPNMLIPLIIFQKELGYGFDQMNDDQSTFMKYWYWASVFSQRYTGSSNEKIIQDCNILTLIAGNQKVKDRSYFNKLGKLVINNSKDLFGYDKKQNAVYKGVLNFINYSVNGYKDWNNTSKISFRSEIDDHHIFPKDFIAKSTKEEDEERDVVDCVVNRTLIPKITNIRIGNKAPSQYLSEIQSEKNKEIESCLITHFIDSEILSGQYDNNLIFFLELRAEEIFKQLQTDVINKHDEVKSLYYAEPTFDKSSQIKVTAKYYKKSAEGVFNPKTGALQYNGKLFDTPSGAGMQAKEDLGAPEGSTVNGWTFWRYFDPVTNEERFIDTLRN